MIDTVGLTVALVAIEVLRYVLPVGLLVALGWFVWKFEKRRRKHS